MKSWVLKRKGGNFTQIGELFHISPRLAALIRNRDVEGTEAIRDYLSGSLENLGDGMQMKDMDRAIEVTLGMIRQGKSIRIIGDYDIDGVNATYILLRGLRYAGADVDYDIPDRMKDGYGLNRQLIDRALEDRIEMIITCDNGIAAEEEIRYAKEQGITVVVTDHHEIPYQMEGERRIYRMPPADAVIDPKREDCPYPFKELCGAAVAYKFVEALCNASGKDANELDGLIENVAIATVGDVMDLVGENRILVKQGLAMLKETDNMGLKALMECTGVDTARLNAYHIGFVIGPCINAGGRLDTAKRALELLCAKTKMEADVLAGDLKALNDSRKAMTEEALKEAIRQIEEEGWKEERVLVVYLPNCHESLAGIVAGRIRERYYKPVFVLTDAEDGVKGSGRSIEAYHMYEEMNRVSDLFTKFGGHKMAAGLSLPKEHVDLFRIRINERCTLTEEELTEKVVIDMKLPFSSVTESFISELELLEPFGKGNTKPVFAESNVQLLACRILGKARKVLKLTLKDEQGIQMEGMYFGDPDSFFDFLEEKYGTGTKERILSAAASGILLDITYYPTINEFRGMKTCQIVVGEYR